MNRLFKGFLSLIFCTGTLCASQALAFPLTSTHWNQGVNQLYFDKGFPYDGILALSNCSASLIHFKGVSLDAPAVALTNGHCVSTGWFGGLLDPGEVYYQKPSSYSFSLLNQKGSRIATLYSKKIIYATMTDTDMALLELTQTYRQIQNSYGVAPLEMAQTPPTDHTDIHISSGYWNRTYTCQIETTVPVLREADWTFKNSLRYSAGGCDVVGGTSGSPIISVATGEVIAVNNTGNEDGRSCTLNNPCEVDGNGKITVLEGRGYGQQTYEVYDCLNSQGQFDLSLSSCPLPRPQD